MKKRNGPKGNATKALQRRDEHDHAFRASPPTRATERARLEPLEPRLLMSVSLTDNIADQYRSPDDPALILDLNDYFTDDATSDRFVRFDSVLGDFFIELFPLVTPITVTNFLNYVQDGRYNDSLIHRSVPDFVLQGGGFNFFSDEDDLEQVPIDPPIVNEFDNWFDPNLGGLDPDTPLNLRGTLSMAKLGGDPDSATSGFFINLVDNASTLDPQNGGFTVFAEIEGNGMEIIDALAALPIHNFGAAFTHFPLLDDAVDPLITKSNLVLFHNVETSDLKFELIANDNPDILDITVDAGGTLSIDSINLGGGTATITLRGTDLDDETTADETFAITIDGPPVANDDEKLSDNELDPLLITVLANDFAVSAIDASTVTIVDQPDFGDVVVDPVTGVATYTLRPEFVDQDTFTYTVMDIDGRTSNEATVTITVEKAPVAEDDSFDSTDVNATIEIDVLANDTDFNGAETIDASTVTIVQAPNLGTVEVAPDTGVVTYTFNDGTGGDDTFRYTVDDTSGHTSNEATVSLSVQSNPVAETDNISVDIPSGSILIPVLDNDSDDNGNETLDPMGITIVSDPSHGSISVDPGTGMVTYTPETEIATNGGNDSFTYTIADITGRVSSPAVVTIAIEAPPVANDDEILRTVLDVDAAVAIYPLINDSDTNSNDSVYNATLAIVSDPALGAIEIEIDPVGISYTPGTGFTGSDTFTYTITDNTGRVSNIATVTLDIRTAPVAEDDNIIIGMDPSPVVFDLLANDTDGNGNGTIDRATLTIVDDSSEGTIAIDPTTHEITYTPGLDFDGGDSFTYNISDATGLVSNIAMATIGFPVDTSFGNFSQGNNLTIAINGVDVTFMLSGPGHGNVVGAGGGKINIDLLGTETTSRHTITTRGGDNHFLVHDITANGSLATITARTTNLGGNITIPGTIGSINMADVADNHVIDILGNADRSFVRMTFRDVANLVINSSLPIQSLVVNSWTDDDGNQDEINAPSITRLQSKGAFQADLNLDHSNAVATTLSVARIAGAITNATWTIVGNVGNVITGDVHNLTLNVNRDGDNRTTVRRLQMGRVFGATDVTVEGTIFSIRAASWSTGTIRAEQVRSIQIIGLRGNRLVGDFGPNLELEGGNVTGPRLFKIVVADAISHSIWNVDGTIGSILAAQWEHGELNAVAVNAIVIQRNHRDKAGGYMRVDMNLAGDDPARRLGMVRVDKQIKTSTWNIDGPVGAIRANSIMRLTLDLNAPLSSLKVGKVSNSDFNVAGRIGRLLAESWEDGSITATSIGRIYMQGSRRSLGSFSADVTLTGDPHPLVLGGVRILGAITGGDWNLNGDAGYIQAMSWDSGSFTASSLRAVILRPAPLFTRMFGLAGDMGIDLTLTGTTNAAARLRTLQMRGAIFAGRWQIDGDILSLTTSSTNLAWSGNVTGNIRNLKVLRDLSGTLTASSFGTVTIRGELNRATLLAGADLGADMILGGTDADADTFGSGSINQITVLKRVRASTIGAGLDPVNGSFNDGDDVIIGGGDSFINRLTIRGTLDENTMIGAGHYPTRIMLGGQFQPSATAENLLW